MRGAPIVRSAAAMGSSAGAAAAESDVPNPSGAAAPEFDSIAPTSVRPIHERGAPLAAHQSGTITGSSRPVSPRARMRSTTYATAAPSCDEPLRRGR